jgi:hypothetical protein
VPPTAAPMIAPFAVEPTCLPMIAPAAPPAAAPITAPFCVFDIEAHAGSTVVTARIAAVVRIAFVIQSSMVMNSVR